MEALYDREARERRRMEKEAEEQGGRRGKGEGSGGTDGGGEGKGREAQEMKGWVRGWGEVVRNGRARERTGSAGANKLLVRQKPESSFDS